MTDGRKKYHSREVRARIREVLMEHWDPFGVIDAPEAADEYDDYVGCLCVILMDEQAGEATLAAYLTDVLSSWMGLTIDEELAERTTLTASILVDLRPGFEAH
jgi:hypothetical protein